LLYYTNDVFVQKGSREEIGNYLEGLHKLFSEAHRFYHRTIPSIKEIVFQKGATNLSIKEQQMNIEDIGQANLLKDEKQRDIEDIGSADFGSNYYEQHHDKSSWKMDDDGKYRQQDDKFDLTIDEADKIFGEWLVDKKEIEEYRQKMNMAIRLIREVKNSNYECLIRRGDRSIISLKPKGAGKEAKAFSIIDNIQEELLQKFTKTLENDLKPLAEFQMSILKQKYPEFKNISMNECLREQRLKMIEVAMDAINSSKPGGLFTKDQLYEYLTNEESPDKYPPNYELLVAQKLDEICTEGYADTLYELYSKVYKALSQTIPGVKDTFLEKTQ
jgi:hypothetical protein